MPREATTTREAIVEGAFELVRHEGLDALTARSLAAELGCSTQPIMYRFPDLSELREEVYRRADEFHTRYILEGEDLMGIGLRYVRFAAEEPRLFRLLFQSGHFDGESLQGLIHAPEVAPVLQAMGPLGSDDLEAAAKTFECLYVAVHGYASLIANNAMDFDELAVEKTLLTIGSALLGEGDTP